MTKNDEKIALLLNVLWTCYHNKLHSRIPDESLMKEMFPSEIAKLRQAFENLNQNQAGFIALVIDIITKQ